MPSLQGDRDSIPTGEPQEIKSTPEERVVEAETADYRFVQSDVLIGKDEEFMYTRTAERRGGDKKEKLQASVTETIEFEGGKETNREIRTLYNDGKGIRGSGSFTQVRRMGNVLQAGESSESNVFDYAETALTADLSQPDEYLTVQTRKGSKTVNPENDPRLDPRRTETSAQHVIVHSVSDFRQHDGHETPMKYANGKIFRVRIRDEQVVIQSTGVLTDAIVRAPDGTFILMSPLQHPDESLFTDSQEMDLREFREKSGLALYITQAELNVQNQPGTEIILDPEKSYLIAGGLDAKPKEPFKDFVAKEVLRAI